VAEYRIFCRSCQEGKWTFVNVFAFLIAFAIQLFVSYIYGCSLLKEDFKRRLTEYNIAVLCKVIRQTAHGNKLDGISQHMQLVERWAEIGIAKAA
jgi:hypothetical protein